jgi:superfamily I DNA/RNA helicase
MRSITDDEAMAQAVRNSLSSHDDPDDGENATVYLLTRTNYQLGMLSSALQRHGVPFDAIGDKMDPWPEKVVDCLIALRALRRGSPAPQEPVDTLLDVATNSELREERFNDADFDRNFRVDLGSDAVYFPERIKAAFPGRSARTIVDILDLTDYQKDMLRGALESDAAPFPERVQVGTIHEVKGLEAPCVFLFTEVTENIMDRYQSGETRAEEHRIFYVGATRASESLHVVDGFFDGPRIPIFADGLPGHETDNNAEQEVAD